MPTVEQFLESLGRTAEGTSRAFFGDFLPVENLDTADSLGNALLFPAAPQRPHTDVLAAVRGGLVTDSSLRPRVSAIVGPGATIRGIARAVHPVFVAGASAANTAPTVDELAQAIVVYSEFYLPAANMRGYADGLRIPLPIEIEQPGGDWVVNGNTIRLWARSFQPAWAPHLDRRPARLDQPDLAALPNEAAAFLRDQATALARGIHLLARVLTNPFREVFFFFEALKQMETAARFEACLAFLDNAVNHQMALLASLTAGHAILKRIDRVLAGNVLRTPAGQSAAQTESRTRGRAMLQRALMPGGRRVARRELPETAQQLAERPGGVGARRAVQADDPAGGLHRIVLGRDVLAGEMGSFTLAGKTFRGVAYAGRIDAAAFIAAHKPLINPPDDPILTDRHRLVAAVSVNEGHLDGVRMRDRGLLSVGIQQWSAHDEHELASLLAHFALFDEDGFDLFFGIYDLAVTGGALDANGNATFVFQRVEPDDTRVDLETPAARLAFFGGRTAGSTTTFATHWAARCREAVIASLTFRATEVIEAANRFNRIIKDVGNLKVGRNTMKVDRVISSELGVALILDAHISMPDKVRATLQAAINATDTNLSDDAFDRAITQRFRTTRQTADTPTRNANIARLGLDPGHGSFGGW